jgi:hypothetical protein
VKIVRIALCCLRCSIVEVLPPCLGQKMEPCKGIIRRMGHAEGRGLRANRDYSQYIVTKTSV